MTQTYYIVTRTRWERDPHPEPDQWPDNYGPVHTRAWFERVVSVHRSLSDAIAAAKKIPLNPPKAKRGDPYGHMHGKKVWVHGTTAPEGWTRGEIVDSHRGLDPIWCHDWKGVTDLSEQEAAA